MEVVTLQPKNETQKGLIDCPTIRLQGWSNFKKPVTEKAIETGN